MNRLKDEDRLHVILLPDNIKLNDINLESTIEDLGVAVSEILDKTLPKAAKAEFFFQFFFTKFEYLYSINFCSLVSTPGEAEYALSSGLCFLRTETMFAYDNSIQLRDILQTNENVILLHYLIPENLRKTMNKTTKKKAFEDQSTTFANVEVEDHLKPLYEYKEGHFDDIGHYKNYVANFDIKIDRPVINVILIIHKSVTSEWRPHILSAIQEINIAAPRLNLVIRETNNFYEAKKIANNDLYIFIQGNCITGFSFTESHIQDKNHECKIILADDWASFDKKRTALHEILHALGFQHEHQRADGFDYFHYYPHLLKDERMRNQYLCEFPSLTKVDPFSVMLYVNEIVVQKKKTGISILDLNPNRIIYSELSELDKLGLNLLYPASLTTSPNYTPKLGKTGLYYCGRPVMHNHNKPVKAIYEVCGPNKGPNCPSCRVFKTEKSEKIKTLKKFQGMSGMVYCGRKLLGEKIDEFHDGVCGPDNGLGCKDCSKYI